MSRLLILFQRSRRFWIVSHILFSFVLWKMLAGLILSDMGIYGWDGWGALLAGLAATVALPVLTLLELLHARRSPWLYSLVGVFEVVCAMGGGSLFVFELFYDDLIVPVTALCLWLFMTGLRDLTMARTNESA